MLKFLTCEFEAYIEVTKNEEEHLVQVNASGSISSHSGVSDISIESIFSLDSDQEVPVRKVSINDMKRLMELAEESLLVEETMVDSDSNNDEESSYNQWLADEKIDRDTYAEWLISNTKDDGEGH